MNYYARYSGDYLRDTAHLTLAQHGAYNMLLDTYYSTERPLPGAFEALYRICRAIGEVECTAVREVADQYFPIDPADGLRHNNRADREIEKARPRLEAARNNGKKRGGTYEKRQVPAVEESGREPTGYPSGSASNNPLAYPAGRPPGKPVGTHRVTQPGVGVGVGLGVKDTSTPTTAIAVVVADATGAATPARSAENGVPDCPHQQIVDLYHELMPLNPQVVAWTERRQGMLRVRWREASITRGNMAGYKTTSEGLVWWRRLFEVCGDSEFLTGRAAPMQGRSEPFMATLEWMLNPANFLKIIEGKYHARN